MLHFLLQQFKEKKTCEDFYFYKSAELWNDEFLEEIQYILTNTNDEKIIVPFVTFLTNREDDVSIGIILKLLDSENNNIKDTIINTYSTSPHNNIFKNQKILEKLKKI
jgi:hypothetical protein